MMNRSRDLPERGEPAFAAVPFVIRSSFMERIAAAIAAVDCADIRDIRVALGAGGYAGEMLIELTPGDPFYFSADWKGSDATRFPVRIRAAATVLADRGCSGRFLISHNDGHMVISRVGGVLS